MRIRVAVGWSALLLFLFAPPAQAELVGEFNARLKDVKRSYGAYTVVADARVYDTTGVPPPPLAGATVHFPRGAALRRAFLADRFLCDPAPLEVHPDPGLCRGGEFASRPHRARRAAAHHWSRSPPTSTCSWAAAARGRWQRSSRS